MKTLLSSKTLLIAFVAIALTGCGGSDSKNSTTSSTPASSAAPSSTPASSVAPSSTPASSVEASSSSAASSTAPTAALVIYEEDEIPAWHLWDCCGGTTPVAITASDVDHGKVAQFTIHNGSDGGSVVGFTARNGDGAVGGTPFNATSIETTGTIQFDLKLITAPTAGVGVWKIKVESTTAPVNTEINLSTSHEGHTAPVVGTWQTYTFNLSAFHTPIGAMEVFMIFPAWGTGDGAVFQVDNVKIWATGATL